MRFAWAAVLLLLCANLSAFAQTTPPLRSRADFAAAMAKVKEQMPENQVLALLGPPDDIRTEVDADGPDGKFIKEVWCYGTDGHMGFPTLGCVYIETNRLAEEIFGGQGQPPSTNLFTEAELQKLLRVLNTAPTDGGSYFNPLTMIHIVNALQPLGRDKALAVIDEYLRVVDQFSRSINSSSDLCPLLMVLFDLPDDMDPGLIGTFGVPEPPPPVDFHRMPRFPIVLVDDIPLMYLRGYTLFGMEIPPSQIVNFFRAHGRIRPKPLVPGDDPLAALKKLMKLGIPDESETEKTMLMEQLLRLIDSVYRLPVDTDGSRLPSPCDAPPEPAWAKFVNDVTALKIKWDPNQQLYTFQNGQHLPILPKKIYRRVIWPLAGLGFDHAEIIMERKNDQCVDLTLDTSETSGALMHPGVLELSIDGLNQPSLATFSFTNNTGVGEFTSRSQTIKLMDGTAVIARVVVVSGCQTITSPVFKP